MVSVPLIAPSEPPETGASTYPIFFARNCSANRRVASGAIEEQSMIRAPSFSEAITPVSGSSNTRSTSGVSDTQHSTMSTSLAAEAGVSARAAPIFSRGSSRLLVRF